MTPYDVMYHVNEVSNQPVHKLCSWKPEGGFWMMTLGSKDRNYPTTFSFRYTFLSLD